MSFNLPHGTWDGDPRAPWNQPDDPECRCGEVMEWDDEHEENRCSDPDCEYSDSDTSIEDAALERAIDNAEIARDRRSNY